MKKSVIFAGICIMLLVVSSVFAQGTPSAKFAATWDTDPGIGSVININWTSIDAGGTAWVDPDEGYTLATIKVPNNKELLVGVSAEIGIVTDTSIKGKNGGQARAIAGGQAYVNVFAVPTGEEVDPGSSLQAMPGQVMLSQRVQELEATLGGVIQSCEVSCSLENDAVVCEDIDIADDCEVTDEEIGLLLDTTAAHHYNFVFPDLPVGTYDIVAVFTTGVRAQVDICDPGDACVLPYDEDGDVAGRALASAIINNTMVTVQEVRAIQDEFIEVQ